jgi:hypothetical protein
MKSFFLIGASFFETQLRLRKCSRFCLEVLTVFGYNTFWINLNDREATMKNVNLLIWLTQLGISVAAPLGGFIWLGVWLRQRFDLGVWVVLAGIFLGVVCAVDGMRVSLKAMERMAKDKKDTEPPPVSFNDHE